LQAEGRKQVKILQMDGSTMMTISRIRSWWNDEAGCYDLEVLDPSATVADYEQTVSKILAAPDAIRRYGDCCVACSICCGGRLSLTVVDLYRLKMGGLGMALPLDGWVAAHGTVQRQDGCVDITLRLDDHETCALWDRKAGLCSIYESRPLICRTYICAPYSWRASELRGQIVNAGEDELVRMLGLANANGGTEQPQPFAGVLDYGGVLLRDVCSDRLWRCLTSQTG
jgi:Fe-S-cluster containining protein